MIKLFSKNDVLTLLSREHVKVGDKGYFSDNLKDLATNVKRGEVHSLVKVNDEDCSLYPFKGDHHGQSFALFLPANKVKIKKQTFRPLANFDELFNFLVPGLDTDCDISEKVKLILSRIYELKGTGSGNIYYRVFTHICISDDNILLDECNLEHFFENYKIKKNGEFVPFGIKEG